MAAVYPRGGVAGGDPSKNPSDSTYAAIPPSSTYKGPEVAGTYGGFVGVLVGVGVFVLLILAGFMLVRYRQLKRKAVQSGGEGYERGGAWVADDAFELPTHQALHSQSTVNLDSPPLHRAPRLYAQDGISQEALFEEGASGRYRDPYGEPDGEGYDRDRSPTPTPGDRKV
ncbi:hypothetical protein Rt10032_c08g3479 [Rhodotorula toruloides]|uniref:Uncharacterized protein n=1 Tax=Rhodotorula toruloides TaxID=5286 RepID=A0A511KGJ5_RHOTO|nr:hypothetical protein Rt10032_c08g3479 [Rhodotorula toruloides]